MAERSPEDIQRDIEASRAALAQAVDELAFRTNPKRAVEKAKTTIREKAQSPEGKAVIYATAGLLVIIVIRRVRRR